MKRKLKNLTSVLFLIATFMQTPQLAHAMEDAIIAIVNDELITLKDMKEFMRNTYMELTAEGRPPEQIQQVMLDMEINGIHRLIEERIVLSHANTLELQINDKVVTEKIEKIKERYPSEQVFMDSLVQHGGTLTDMRNKISSQLKIQYVVDYEVSSKIRVNPQEVTDYYEKNREAFRRGDRIYLESIFIAFRDNPTISRAKAKEAYEKIQNGSDFLSVADEYSDTPSVGLVEKGQMRKNIEDKVFALKENEVSEIFEIDNGIYIFQLTGRIASETIPLAEAKNKITKFLFNQKFEQNFKTWLNELKENAYIEIKQ